jgi:CubicO group peptidase (beta-lactamase class C family)
LLNTLTQSGLQAPHKTGIIRERGTKSPLPFLTYFEAHLMNFMKRLLLSFALAATVQTAFAQAPSFVSDSIDAYIARGMKDWDVPGLSVVIVKDGKVAFIKGYGVRDVSTQEPVDEQTLFMIASNSKLFTGTALALLEHRGKLSLNDAMVKYFPTFRLYDPAASKMVSIRDMLSHRIGTKTFQGDFTFWNTALSREQIMGKMRLLKPSGVFRQDYGYCNSCFLAAGEVVPKVTGRKWEEFVQDSMILPLAMNSTMVLSTGIDKKPNAARPYTTAFTGKMNRVAYDNWNNLAPAASIISNVSDLSHWLMMQLDSGRYQGKQILPWPVLLKTRDVNIVTGSRKSSLYPIHFRGYGLGLFAADYNGRAVYWHTGGAGGMLSNVSFIPEERLGIAILTNNDNQNFFEALRYQIMDAYLGVPYVDRSRQQLGAFREEMREQVKQIEGWKNRVKNTKPELPLSAYTGVYTNELYGNITITQKGNGLKVAFGIKPDLSAGLAYMDNGEWLIEYNMVEYGIFTTRFKTEKGKVKSVIIKANEFVEMDPYEFTKK